MRVCWTPTADRDEPVMRFFRRWGVPEEVARNDGGMAALARALQEAVEVDVVLAGGDRIEVGDFVFEVIETPGHCEGHIVFYERDTRTLFSGDHLLPDISPVPLLAFPKNEDEPRPRSLIRFLRSLERVEGLDCAITFPSHGDTIPDHRALIASYRLHHDKRSLQLERMLAAGPKTPFEIASRMFPRAIPQQIMLVMSEVMGHLDVLEERGVIAIETRGDLDYAVLRTAGASSDV
jgi:glyoxylase-like metal-dependent hydrolase (beta-lactamase superfamily II)